MTTPNKYSALPDHARCRILIFDSASILAKRLTDVLHELGYMDVHSLFSAKLTLATLLKTVRYHAILVDLSLPDLDGLRLIYQIREHFSAADLPILAIADVDPPDVCNAALLAGANDFLAKPVDRINLALRLRNQLTINSIHNATRIVRHQLERQAASSSAKLNMLIDNSALMADATDRQALIRHTLFEGKRLLHCDAASMYLVTEHKTLRFAMRTRDDALVTNDIALFDATTGEPNERYVSTYCALHKRSVVIDDVYAETRFDLSGTREFDAHSGYRTVSLLTVPMICGDGKVVGVLQYINKLDSVTEAFARFHPDLIALVEALASQVAVALDHLALSHARAQQEAASRGLAMRLTVLDRQQRIATFAASLRQDLRQPLVAIEAAANGVQHALVNGAAASGQIGVFVEQILLDVRRANALVERLGASADSPQGAWVAVDLNAVLLDVVALLADEAHANQVQFRLPPESHALSVMGEPIELAQLFYNLLRNALDAVKLSEHRDIQVAMHHEGAQAVVRIQDSGPGLREQDLEHIGSRASKESPTATGCGLGVFIARSIAARLSGDLTITNRPNTGAQVEVRLPIHVQQDSGGALPG